MYLRISCSKQLGKQSFFFFFLKLKYQKYQSYKCLSDVYQNKLSKRDRDDFWNIVMQQDLSDPRKSIGSVTITHAINQSQTISPALKTVPVQFPLQKGSPVSAQLCVVSTSGSDITPKILVLTITTFSFELSMEPVQRIIGVWGN